MKKVSLITLCALCVAFFSSCNKVSSDSFIGIWGVEKIEYYNIDYAGNPIAATIKTYEYDPQDIDHGIQLVFKADQTGEMRDNDVDTVWYELDGESLYVVNPDTTLVTNFKYSYDKRSSTLYLTTEKDPRPFLLKIHNMSHDSFIYENEWHEDYVERAFLKRLSNTAPKSTSRNNKTTKHPHIPGSFLGSR